MFKRKKGMQEQPAATQKVGVNELSDDLLEYASGGAYATRGSDIYVLDDDGKLVYYTEDWDMAMAKQKGMKSEGVRVSTYTDDYINYRRGGGINGQWGKDHGYHD